MAKSEQLISSLRETLGRMEIALNSIHEAILWTDEAGCIVWCNNSFDRLLSRPHLTLLGAEVTEVLVLEDESGIIPVDRHPCRLLATQSALSDKLFIFRKNGKPLTLEISGSSTELSSRDRIIILTIRNVTSLRLSQEQLKQAKATLEKRVVERTNELYRLSRRYENILEEAVDGIITIDREGNIIGFNPAAEGIFQYREGEVLGKNVSMLMPAPHRESHDQYIRNYIDRGVRKVIGIGREVPGLRRDGTLVPLELSVSESGYRDERLFTGILRDITKRKKVEAALERARLNAENASRVKSDFLARMSHEMRTPMNAILGMAELLLETGLNSEQERYIKTSESAGRHLLSIVNDLLDLEKIEAGKFELEAVPFELRTLIADTCDILSVAAGKKGIVIEFTVSPDTPVHAVGDPLRLQQVLINLIGNGIKFTERGGVYLSVSAGAGTGEDNGAAEGVELLFEIRDTGTGIEAEDIDRIFDRFVQTRQGAESRYGGSGLGLAISKNLIRQMGGDITVSSVPDEGATFSFTCRVKKSEKRAEHEERRDTPEQEISYTPAPGSHARILLAEDSPDNRFLFEAYLKGYDCSLEIAVNGQIAVEKFTASSFDLILMDIEMPVLDGYSATREIRAYEREQGLGHVPIIALSAHAAEKEEKRALAAGCDRYLSKPVGKDDLRRAVCGLLGAHQSARSRPAEAETEMVTVEIDDLIEDLVPAFLENRRGDVLKLREAAGTKDMEVVAFLGHTMKGTGGGYGFAQISELGQAFERAAQRGDAERVLRLADELENYLDSLNIVFVEKGVGNGFNPAG